MNIKHLFFLFLLALILSVPPWAQAQTGSDWQLIGLTIGGNNIKDGVEAFFQINTCNGKDVIYVKFINRNNNPVKVAWVDAIFTEELKWIYKDAAVDKKSLIIPANGEVKGECSNSLTAVLKNAGIIHNELLVEVKDFVLDKKDLKLYSAGYFSVIEVK